MAIKLFILSMPFIFLAGCAAKHPHPVDAPQVPYTAHFDRTKCRYMPDGVMFRCKDVVFDPQKIDARKK